VRRSDSCIWMFSASFRRRMLNITILTRSQRHPALVSSYAFVHAITLTVISLVLFISIFPASLSQANSIHFGGNFEQSICHGSVDGLGWNAAWFEQCKSNFRLLSTGAAWISSILMAAQWWALFGVCKWNSGMKNERQKREQDIEERGYSNEKDELWT
jgi:hypothetical protein